MHCDQLSKIRGNLNYFCAGSFNLLCPKSALNDLFCIFRVICGVLGIAYIPDWIVDFDNVCSLPKVDNLGAHAIFTFARRHLWSLSSTSGIRHMRLSGQPATVLLDSSPALLIALMLATNLDKSSSD